MSFALETNGPAHYMLETGLPGVRLGFFTAHGGVSRGVYESLNCGLGSDDDREDVLSNRARAASAIGLAAEALARVHQVHGRQVVQLHQGGQAMHGEAPEADALVTDQAEIGLSILTADCVPVLFADPARGVIGACHAGWRGAAAGVVQETMHRMREMGARDITALVGPAIRQQSYQVGAEMREEFLATVAPGSRDAAAARFSADPKDPSRHLFDLPGFVGWQLAGFEDAEMKVCDCGIDTYGHRTGLSGFEAQGGHTFFSHRRASHAALGDSGRQINVIAIEA